MATAAAPAGGKRARNDASNGGGVAKRSKDSESVQTAVGTKSKPCTKFFSTSGCPFGEGCHFLHYVPGGYQAAASQMGNVGNPALGPPPSRMGHGGHMGPPISTVKTRMCNKYNTAEGCKWGDKCHFAHGERELGRPVSLNHDPMSMAHRPMGHFEPPPPMPDIGAPGNFGTSATAKISVDGNLAGAIIGKGGVNTKQICRVTGAKLAIRDHESDPNLKNIELEGTFDQIKQASTMVKELIYNISNAGAPPPSNLPAPAGGHGRAAGRAANFKTKLCENFTKGTCTFGDKCHFAHGEEELRKPPAAA